MNPTENKFFVNFKIVFYTKYLMYTKVLNERLPDNESQLVFGRCISNSAVGETQIKSVDISSSSSECSEFYLPMISS